MNGSIGSWRRLGSLGAAGLVAACVLPGPARAGLDPFISEIHTYAFRFCPKGEAPLDGQTLAISSNTALFSLIGTIFGGDGETKFQLPLARQAETLTIGSPFTRCISMQGLYPPRP